MQRETETGAPSPLTAAERESLPPELAALVSRIDARCTLMLERGRAFTHPFYLWFRTEIRNRARQSLNNQGEIPTRETFIRSLDHAAMARFTRKDFADSRNEFNRIQLILSLERMPKSGRRTKEGSNSGDEAPAFIWPFLLSQEEDENA